MHEPDQRVALDALVAALKAAGEPTRLRILALLAEGDLSVKDLTTILGQSQPRISRHLKLLVEAELVHRFPEGAWAYYRLADGMRRGGYAAGLLNALDDEDPPVRRDRERREAVRRAHAEAAAAYFAENAASWNDLRRLHVSEDAVEAALREVVGPGRFNAMLDIGTGTGRMLELFGDLYSQAIGIDQSQPMLSVARANLEAAGEATGRDAQVRQGDVQVRHGDVLAITLPPGSFDLVTIHQVLHFLDDPHRAVSEAARMLRPGGRLLIVDFAPHGLEFLRSHHAHRRLGFDHATVEGWIIDSGLEPVVTRDLAPLDGGGADEKLTVTIWLARDPRLEIAAGTHAAPRPA